MFERNGVWYFMYSSGDWKNDSYSVKYCTASTPFGPFECRGKVLFSQLPLATGAGHHSVLSVPGTDEWYICYHRRPIPNLSPNHRVTCLDRMYFNEDGTMVSDWLDGSNPGKIEGTYEIFKEEEVEATCPDEDEEWEDYAKKEQTKQEAKHPRLKSSNAKVEQLNLFEFGND